MAYYYLAAQLPYLVYGQNPPMSSASFRELCLSSLSADDAALLYYCTLDPEKNGVVSAGLPEMSDMIDNWRVWEQALRLNLARYRAQKLKREGGASIDPPEHPASASSVAKTASGIESPLEAELFLDKSRWDAIEAFQGIDYFDRNTIYAYLLKLQLMERRASFRVDEGFAEYKGLYTAIMAASENT